MGYLIEKLVKSYQLFNQIYLLCLGQCRLVKVILNSFQNDSGEL